MITEQDFKTFKWDCDICPLYPCGGCGMMLTEDCFDDVIAFWRKMKIVPEYGFTQAIESRI